MQTHPQPRLIVYNKHMHHHSCLGYTVNHPHYYPHIAMLHSSMLNTKCALPPRFLTELSAVALETQEPQHAATHEQDS
jgi:putative hemolysin